LEAIKATIDSMMATTTGCDGPSGGLEGWKAGRLEELEGEQKRNGKADSIVSNGNVKRVKNRVWVNKYYAESEPSIDRKYDGVERAVLPICGGCQRQSDRRSSGNP